MSFPVISGQWFAVGCRVELQQFMVNKTAFQTEIFSENFCNFEARERRRVACTLRVIGIQGSQGKACGFRSAAEYGSPLSAGGSENKVGIVRLHNAYYNGTLCDGCWGLEVPLQPQRALISEFAFKRSSYQCQRL